MNVYAEGNVVVDAKKNIMNVSVYNKSCDDSQDFTSSQDIFEDDNCQSLNVLFSPVVNVTHDNTNNSSIVLLRTPMILKHTEEETPGKAKIPKTPADLLPFITKPNFIWTSDMETPESKLLDKSNIACNESNNLPYYTCTPPQLIMSSKYENVLNKNMDVLTSPVLGGKKRSKKIAKRRILSSMSIDLDKDEQYSSSSNSDKGTLDKNELITIDNEQPTSNSMSKININDAKQIDENKKVEDVVVSEKNSNTSTQDFFGNASFGSVDRLCSNIVQDEKPKLINCHVDVDKSHNNKLVEQVIESEDVDNDVLDRVISIKRNQKPLRRLMDINHTVITDQAFPGSSKELDLKSGSEKKNVNNESLKTSLEFDDMGENLIEFINDSEHFFDDEVCQDFIDNDWNVNSKEKANVVIKEEKPDVKIEAESLCGDDLSLSNDYPDETQDGFKTANGKNINVSEDKVQNYEKIYREIEKENLSDNFFKDLQKTKKSLLKLKVGKNSTTTAESSSKSKTETLKLLKELDLHEFLKPQSSNDSSQGTQDGFTTATGQIKQEKENYCSNSRNKYSDVNENSLLNNDEKKNELQSVDNQTSNTEFNKKNVFSSNTNNIIKENIATSDLDTTKNGFSTAGGKKIEINDEKQNYYSNVYNEIGDVDENNLSILKNKRKKLSLKLNMNPKDKVVTTFNVTNSIENKTETNEKQTDDGFSTAGGKKINVSDEKENFYSRFYQEIEEDPENILTSLNKTKSRLLCAKKPTDKVVLVFNKKKNESTITSNALATDVNRIVVFDTQAAYSDNFSSINDNNNFANQNEKFSTTFVKKESDCFNVPITMNKNKNDVVESDSCRVVKSEYVPTSNCESKTNSEKDEYKNLPSLEKSLSASQCFDPHSDTLLSTIELSDFNSNKTELPNLTVEKNQIQVDDVTNEFCDFFGFSFQESTESFRNYLNFQKFTKKKFAEYNESTDLFIKSGEKITINNQTASKQHLLLQNVNNLKVKKNVETSEYILTLVKPVIKSFKPIEEIEITQEVIKKSEEKRKYKDTDIDDTPLSVLKKPRIGFEMQRKRLLFDELDVQEINESKVVKQSDESVQRIFDKKFEQTRDRNLNEERRLAALKQQKIIASKNKIKIKPVVGILLQERLTNGKNRKSWTDFVGDAIPVPSSIEQVKYYHPDAKVLEVTASNAANYKFFLSDVVGNEKIVSLDAGDGASLIFNENDQAGVGEFTNALLAMPGVDPKLIPNGWIQNHYRWIIWKLASMDRVHFDSVKMPKALKPQRVLQELKYRYDREICRAERPALRRILEKDDAATRRMVLCICSIEDIENVDESNKQGRVKLGLSRWKVEATDGWYSIPITLDTAMTNYVLNGKIKEGTKIITYGAELLNCEMGCYPLEKLGSASLKIHGNSTRRARWDTKLGFQPSSRAVPVKLKSIVSNGGLVGQMTVAAARVYPLLYREKTSSGQSIFRNARSEEKAVMEYERLCERKVDAIYAEAQKVFDNDTKKDTLDREFPLSQLSAESESQIQTRKQEHFQQRFESKIRNDLPPRQVTSVLKVRLVDDKSTAILSIWGVNEDSGCNIKEGDTITICNAYASGFRSGELSLTANRLTHINTETLLKLPYPVRKYTNIADVMSASFEPAFNEFDTVGIVVSCGPAPHGMKNFEVVSLVYPDDSKQIPSYLFLLFWGGTSAFGYQNFLAPGTIVACSNLEWRQNNNPYSAGAAYFSEKSVCSCNPRQSYLANEIRHLKDIVQNSAAYVENCADKIQIELSKKFKPNLNQSTPSSSFLDKSFVGRNSSPSGFLIQQRMERLSQYGGLSDVSPSIVLKNSSKRVKKDFTPVVPRSNT